MSRFITLPDFAKLSNLALVFFILINSGCTKIDFTQELSKLSANAVPTETPNPNQTSPPIENEDTNSKDAVCGESHLKELTSAPSEAISLCSNGSPSAVTENNEKTKYIWNCSGLPNGPLVECYALISNSSTMPPRPTPSASPTPDPALLVNGSCGGSNGQYLSSVPTTGLCASGTASAVDSTAGIAVVGVSTTKTYKWTCNGSGGGSSATCSATQKLAPLCGLSNGQNVSTTPTRELCSQGTASAVTLGSNKYTWSCSVTNGPTTENLVCAANQVVNGICGTSNGAFTPSAPTTNLCVSGAPSPILTNSAVFPSKYNWNCNGLNSGTTSSCSAIQSIDPACGSSNAQNFEAKPTSNLCASGQASEVTLSDGKFKWSCTTNTTITNTQMCSANQVVNGTCGASNGQYVSSVPTTGLCTSGIASAVDLRVVATLIRVSTPSQIYNWTCNGSGGGSNASCSASQKLTALCGKSNGQTFLTPPVNDLCSSGNQGTVATSATSFDWTCSVTNGTLTEMVSCSAKRLNIPVCGAFKEVSLASQTLPSSVPTGLGEFVRYSGAPIGQRFIVPKESCAIIEAPRLPNLIGFQQLYSVVVDAPSTDYTIQGFYGIEVLKNTKTGQIITVQLPQPPAGPNNMGITVTFTNGSISLTSHQTPITTAWTAWVTQGVAFGGDTSLWNNPSSTMIPGLIRSVSALNLGSYLTANPSLLNTQETANKYSFPSPSTPIAQSICPNPRILNLDWQAASPTTAQSNEHLITFGNPLKNTFIIGNSSCLTVVAPQLPFDGSGFQQLYAVALHGSSSQYTVSGYHGMLVLTNIFTNQQIHLQIARPPIGPNNYGINIKFTNGSISLTTWRNETTWKSFITRGVPLNGDLSAWNNSAALELPATPPLGTPLSLSTYLGANPSLLNTTDTSNIYSFP